MTNAQINARFLAVSGAKIRNRVLAGIANHYGISTEAALAEVTDADAEHLLDYVTGPDREAVSIMMQARGLHARAAA